MATLESNKVDKVLLTKMKAERDDNIDWRYKIYNDQGKQIAVTRISKGPKHTLGSNRVSLMARQLGLQTPKQLIDLVSCTLSREVAIEIIENNS